MTKEEERAVLVKTCDESYAAWSEANKALIKFDEEN